MMLPLDLIDWYDWNGLHLALSSSAPGNDERMRASASSIAIPPDATSVFNDDRVAMNTLRVLAACHDERKYETKSAGMEPNYESAVILGLQRFEHNGQRLGDWSLIKGSPEARQYAQALVAVTNVAWGVAVMPRDSHVFGTGQDDIWLTCPDLVDLAFRHSSNIDPVLRIMDQRHETDPSEIERILSAGSLSEGML
jgi:hypothetical protein